MILKSLLVDSAYIILLSKILHFISILWMPHAYLSSQMLTMSNKLSLSSHINAKDSNYLSLTFIQSYSMQQSFSLTQNSVEETFQRYLSVLELKTHFYSIFGKFV